MLVDSRLSKKGANPKLQPQYVGPFRISKVYCNHSYRLVGYQSLVRQSRLKLYHNNVVEQAVHASPPVVSLPTRAERQPELSTHCGDNNPHTGNSTAMEEELSAPRADISTSREQTTPEIGKQHTTKKKKPAGNNNSSKKTSSRTFGDRRLGKKKPLLTNLKLKSLYL